MVTTKQALLLDMELCLVGIGLRYGVTFIYVYLTSVGLFWRMC